MFVHTIFCPSRQNVQNGFAALELCEFSNNITWFVLFPHSVTLFEVRIHVEMFTNELSNLPVKLLPVLGLFFDDSIETQIVSLILHIISAVRDFLEILFHISCIRGICNSSAALSAKRLLVSFLESNFFVCEF